MFFIVNKIVAVVAKGYRNGLQRYGNSAIPENVAHNQLYRPTNCSIMPEDSSNELYNKTTKRNMNPIYIRSEY